MKTKIKTKVKETKEKEKETCKHQWVPLLARQKNKTVKSALFTCLECGDLKVGKHTIRISAHRMDMDNKPIKNVGTPTDDYDASTKTYVDALPNHGFKNKIINGNFDIWQVGTSLGAGNWGGYLADQWTSLTISASIAVSREAFTIGQTDVPGEPRFYHRSVIVAGTTPSHHATTLQPIESVRTFAGQTITLSFWAKADANKNMSIELIQSFGSGGSPSADVTTIGVEKIALTTAWQKFTKTITVPSITGKTLGTVHDGSLQVWFWFDAGADYNARTDSLGYQAGTFDISQVQLEAGSVATPFEQRPIGLELSLCQRYFEKSYNDNVAPGTHTIDGAEEELRNKTTGITQIGMLRYKVAKRTPAPAPVIYSPIDGATGFGCDNNGDNVAMASSIRGQNGCRLMWTNATDRFGATYQYTVSSRF